MPNKNLTFSILIHYSEIGLKKNNRSYFERLFIKNISNHVFGLDHKKIRLLSARVFIENINPDDWDSFKNRLKKTVKRLYYGKNWIEKNKNIHEIRFENFNKKTIEECKLKFMNNYSMPYLSKINFTIVRHKILKINK